MAGPYVVNLGCPHGGVARIDYQQLGRVLAARSAYALSPLGLRGHP